MYNIKLLMYFPVIDHYSDNDDNDQNKSCSNNYYENNIIQDNECLICLEIIDNTNKNCIKLQNIFYDKGCLCDGWIHHRCLDNWYTNYEKCPICLCNMMKNNIDIISQNSDSDSNTSLYVNNIKYIFLLFCFLYYLSVIIFLSYEVIK